jgi:DNA-binding MarR family transcriptional regulator
MQDNLLRDSCAHALVRTFRQINRRYGRALKPFGVSAEQAHILLTLWIEGPLTIGALQRAVSLSSPTLTGALKRLEEAGQIRRRPVAGDGRAWRIEAVPWEPARLRRLERTMRDEEDACFAPLSSAERRQLHALLTRASAALDEPAERRR